MVQREFEKWMLRTFGTAYTSVSIKKRGPGSRFSRRFEMIMSGFEGDRSEAYELELPMDVASSTKYDESEGYITLSG